MGVIEVSSSILLLGVNLVVEALVGSDRPLADGGSVTEGRSSLAKAVPMLAYVSHGTLDSST